MSFFRSFAAADSLEDEFTPLGKPRRISRGRVEELFDYRGQKVRIVRSARRTRTIEASQRDDVVTVMAPATMTLPEVFRSTKELMSKIDHKRARRPQHSDGRLWERALHLARTWLGNEVMPAEVVWSSRQNTRWGSCTPSTGRIRISTMLQTMPQWVIDGVLVHELAHLKYRNHGDDFKRFAGRYPRMDEAMAFLDGYTHAQHVARKQSLNEPADTAPESGDDVGGFSNDIDD